MSLLLHLIGGYNNLFELSFQEKITSLDCFLEPGLNLIFH